MELTLIFTKFFLASLLFELSLMIKFVNRFNVCLILESELLLVSLFLLDLVIKELLYLKAAGTTVFQLNHIKLASFSVLR